MSKENQLFSPQRLENFPVSFFSMVMGLSGLTIVIEEAQHAYGVSLYLDYLFALITLAVFTVLVVIYAKKIINHRDAVFAELKHPIKLSFFPAISISLLLLSIVFLHKASWFSLLLWSVGSLLHLLFILYIFNSWMHHKHFKIQHMNPAWFIPAVGNVLVPIAGVAHGYIEISWFFFSIGMIFWILLFAIVFNRVLFHDPLPEKLVPTFFILIAPPALGFVSYIKLTGSLDSFAHILYYIGVFLTLLLLSQFQRFLKLQFSLSWWAYSFPMAAITIASFLMYEKAGLLQFALIGTGLLLILLAIIAVLVNATSSAIKKKHICVEE
jgi:tellurite resistance protein